MSRGVAKYVRWLLTWALATLAIVAAGAALGGVIFPLAGRLGGSEKSLAELGTLGMRTLGFYAFVWAPGTAIVITVMRESARRKARADARPR